ncbi:zinc finger protein 771-like [Cotesia glomerata]|uniref:zinc finger protein 771-like n=1 Tax=Cotesia glomerata TaxID=32391 RepID=UPI001D02E84A|nr:zinc finger protein 771-like [Cotesia glomerata]
MPFDEDFVFPAEEQREQSEDEEEERRKVFGCEVCGRRYRRVISLQRHKRLECGKEAQFECIICHSKFKHKHSLLRHYRVHLSFARPDNKLKPEDHQHPDPWSGEGYQFVPEFNPHPVNSGARWRTHADPLNLPAAGQTLAVPGAPTRAQSSHRCQNCGRVYLRATTLRRHMNMECGKAPMYQCRICHGKFTHKHNLAAHMKLHIEEPKFACPTEDLSITGLKWAAAWQRWSVPSIMWRSGGGLGKGFGGSATGNPEGFNCPACGRVYKLKSSLRNHQKWECGKEPQFQCPHCVYRAKQKMHIARHMERMHKEKILKQEYESRV